MPGVSLKSSSTNLNNVWILGGFFVFFLLLLCSIPLSNSIIGSVGTFQGVAVCNTILNSIKQFFFGEWSGTFMYPEDILRFCPTNIGGVSLFILFRSLGLNEVWAMYLFQVCLFTLTAFSMFLLAKQYTDHNLAGFFCAVVFSLSNFLWANIDDSIIVLPILPMLCLYFFHKAVKSGNTKNLFLATIIGGLQFYVSTQTYIYQTMIVATALLFNYQELIRRFSYKVIGIAVTGYVIIALPLFLFYLQAVTSIGAVDVWQDYVADYRLQANDLLSSLPNKFISYPFVTKLQAAKSWGWGDVRDSAFIGLGIPILALIGLKPALKKKWELITIAFIGLLFSFGEVISFGNYEIISPLHILQQYIPITKYLRVNLRSYVFFVLGITILAGFGVKIIISQSKTLNHKLPSILFLVISLFVVAENISWPLNYYETIKYPSIPKGYTEYFEDKPDVLILDLPFNSTRWPGYLDEVLYMNWQTKHKRNIIGGVLSYYPPSRIEAQKNADLLPEINAIKYFRKIGVTHFVLHNYRNLYTNYQDYKWLKETPLLQSVLENDDISIYKFRQTDN